jgi:ubiquinone biosynthesis protein COQ9
MPGQSADPAKAALLAAALPHVAFDGWSPATFNAAAAETGLPVEHARTLCPRGAVDLAALFHQQGDAAMVAAVAAANLKDMRYRDKVAFAVRARIDAISDKEAVRRGTSLFALPHMAPTGAQLIWGTADKIWEALGDTSRDVNWYTKRATLSGVYASVVLYWLGDDSTGAQATDAFINRRIDNVMQFEKVKAAVRDNPLLKPVTGPLGRLLGAIKAPTKIPDVDLPGIWRDPN